MKYFNNKNRGYALKTSEVNTFVESVDLQEKLDNFVAPQSFKYIEGNLTG